MISFFFKKIVQLSLVLTLCITWLNANGIEENTKEVNTEPLSAEILDTKDGATAADTLQELSLVIDDKKVNLKSLRAKLKKSGPDAELEQQISSTEAQLETLSRSFEQIAVGNINVDIVNSEKPNYTWQEELTLVVKPLLENLRGITEKPRKQEDLRQTITAQKQIALKSEKALTSLETLLEAKPTKATTIILTSLREKWLRIKDDAKSNQDLAQYQLDSLNGANESWLTIIKESLLGFMQERGLTLALAVLVSMLIWLVMSGIKWIFTRNKKGVSRNARRTTYRVIAYAQQLLTVLLIIIGVLSVFFIRGDILLLVISMALLFASALGLKNLLPRFIAESRLLLNIGAVRESEQVVIDGVPWRVASINLFSKFNNPEIQGILRIPLSALKEMTSRPVKEDKWFPSSIGDWVLDSDNYLYEVIKQTPLVVELQSSQGTNKLVPTPTYFSAGFVNLTKSNQIRIVSTFGVGYELQSIALDEVPSTFHDFVYKYLQNANLDTEQIEVRVEFQQAGESSLDFLIIALLGSKASQHFYRIQRVIQQACVAACNEKGWGIPFPQLTIHKA